MKIDIVESITISLNIDEKNILKATVQQIEKLKEINLDSNNALELIDEIQKDKTLSDFVDIFGSIL